MNPEIAGRIERLLLARYFQHEVVSIIAVEYPELDEFQLEDLPKHVARIAAEEDSWGK